MITWEQLIEWLYEAIQNGEADEVDLAGVREWPDPQEAYNLDLKPRDLFGTHPDDWPAWAITRIRQEEDL